MPDWTAGYRADIAYTFGCYAELNPVRARFALLNAGFAVSEGGMCCELGFGQGVSINIHAAASGACWHGTDFNPAQAGFAQELARASGAEAYLSDQAFSEFAARSDLPEFDFIGLHGIWSWISDENRQVIVDFVRRRLKVGGVLYVSYNTLPGWAAFAPMRHLMVHHAEVLGAEGHGILSRVDGALDFADRLLAANPGFLRANPAIAERTKKLREQNRHYLAHEYFNSHWQPMHFATMAEWLAPAKLNYACSANLLDHLDPLNLTAEQQALLGAIPDRMFRETVRDFCVNQQFRRDYWIKGARNLSTLEQAEALREQAVVLVTHRADVPLKITAAVGEVAMSEAVYAPILDCLADHQPRTLAELEQAVLAKGLTFGQLRQAVTLLVGAGHLAPVRNPAEVARVRVLSDRLNVHLLQKARGSGDVAFLASPLTGGGVPVDRLQQLFLLSAARGRTKPAEWARDAWQVFAAQGQRLLREGKPIEGSEENLAAVMAQAEGFARKRQPVLQALGIA